MAASPRRFSNTAGEWEGTGFRDGDTPECIPRKFGSAILVEVIVIQQKSLALHISNAHTHKPLSIS